MKTRSSALPASAPRATGVVVPLGFVGDDEALVAALRENHAAAKAAFFQRYAPHVERIITHVIGFDRELADIVQEVFLNALRSIRGLENGVALKAWLSRVSVNTARKVLRTRSRRAWLRLFRDPDDTLLEDEPATPVDQDVLRALRAVYEVLRGLPTDESVAFALRFIEGMELAEMAAACNVSVSTIKRRVSRAEVLFLDVARHRPELEEWLKGGSRWQGSL